jgi:hypothetical protein
MSCSTGTPLTESVSFPEMGESMLIYATALPPRFFTNCWTKMIKYMRVKQVLLYISKCNQKYHNVQHSSATNVWFCSNLDTENYNVVFIISLFQFNFHFFKYYEKNRSSYFSYSIYFQMCNLVTCTTLHNRHCILLF